MCDGELHHAFATGTIWFVLFNLWLLAKTLVTVNVLVKH